MIRENTSSTNVALRISWVDHLTDVSVVKAIECNGAPATEKGNEEQEARNICARSLLLNDIRAWCWVDWLPIVLVWVPIGVIVPVLIIVFVAIIVVDMMWLFIGRVGFAILVSHLLLLYLYSYQIPFLICFF